MAAEASAVRRTDVLLAVAVTALALTLAVTFPRLPAPAVALAVLHTAPLAWRRRFPRAVLGVSGTAAVGVAVLGYPLVILGVAPLVLAYTAAAELDRRQGLVALAAIELAAVAALAAAADRSTILGDALALGAAWLFGDASRRRRRVTELLRERAEQLERTQEEVARRAVAEERLRIARELHDVVAHSMSVVAVQAAAGRLIVDDDPGRAREALVDIERASRSALDEMRRLLDVLRHEDGTNGRRPAPTLADLEELVAQAVEAGVPVSVRVEGARRPLSPGAELTAYRIVQEALTNVRKHAPDAAASVVVSFRVDGVRVEVSDDGGGAPAMPPGTGHGLVGMRERAALYQGQVEAGPMPGGGFRVVAELHDRMEEP